MISDYAFNTIKSLGQRDAQKFSYKWLKDEKAKAKSLDVVLSNDNTLKPGKIHVFNYNPKLKDTLDYYDKSPVVLSLGNLIVGKQILEMGINLNFLPQPYKFYFLDTLLQTYSGFLGPIRNNTTEQSALVQPIIKYKYQPIKTMLDRYGFSFALRTYIPSRKRNVYVVNYKNWENISLLSIEDFEGITLDGVKREFSRKLNS